MLHAPSASSCCIHETQDRPTWELWVWRFLASLIGPKRGRSALVIDPDDGLTKYNAACVCSLVGEHERAIDLLVDLLPNATRERRLSVLLTGSGISARAGRI